MQAGVGLLVTDVMPIFMIIALDIIITLRFSINCSAVICSPTIIIPVGEQITVEQLIEKGIVMRISRHDHVYRHHVHDK